jgi:hypothetical protein
MGFFDVEAVTVEASAFILSLLLIRRIRLRRASPDVRTLTTIVLASALTIIGLKIGQEDSSTNSRVLFGIFVALCSVLWIVHELFPFASLTLEDPCGPDFRYDARQPSGKGYYPYGTRSEDINSSSITNPMDGEGLAAEPQEQRPESDEQEKGDKPIGSEEEPADDARPKGNFGLANRSGDKGKKGILLRGIEALGLGDKRGKKRGGKQGVAAQKANLTPSAADQVCPCEITLCPTGVAKSLKNQISRAKFCSYEPKTREDAQPNDTQLKNGKDAFAEKIANYLPNCGNGCNEMAEEGDFDLLSTNDPVKVKNPKEILDSLTNLQPRSYYNQSSDLEEEPAKIESQPFCKSLIDTLTWPLRCMSDYISQSKPASIGPVLSEGKDKGDSRLDKDGADSHAKDFFVNLACGLAVNDTVFILLTGSVLLLLLMWSVVPLITGQ